MIFSHIIKKVLCGNKSTHCPNCGFEHSSRTRESHLCIDLSVLTARNQATGLGYVIQTRKVWGEDLKTGISRSGIWSRRRWCQGRGRSSSTVYLNEQFESITFESIEVYAFVPPSRDNMRDEVFVKVNIEKATNHLHFNKAKWGTGT